LLSILDKKAYTRIKKVAFAKPQPKPALKRQKQAIKPLKQHQQRRPHKLINRLFQQRLES
jgi:hypothetical protein